jgi:creatinine amidohydrolase/Fe(II)-dependent formamide hydrolase-like protein
MTALTANGVLGDPAGAGAERGETYLELFAEFLAASVGGTSLPAATT